MPELPSVVNTSGGRRSWRHTLLFLPAALLAAGCTLGSVPSAVPSPTPEVAGWSRHDLGESGPKVFTVVPWRQGFMGVGGAAPGDTGESEVWSSTDGVRWTAMDAPDTSGTLVSLTTYGEAVVAISASPAEVWLAGPDGQWAQTEDADQFRDQTLISIATDGETLVIVGMGAIWTSTDARSWEEADAPIEGNNVYDVVAGGQGFVAVGSEYVDSMEAVGRVWTSPDGRDWTESETPPSMAKTELRSVAAADGLLVATGWTTDVDRGLFFTPSAWTSTDGESWTRATVVDEYLPAGASVMGTLEGAVMSAVSRGPDGWIAAGSALQAFDDQAAVDAAIWTSTPDGSTWTRVPHEPRFQGGMSGSLEFGAYSVAFAGGRVVVAGRTAGPQTTVWVSPGQPGGSEPSARPSRSPASPMPSGGTVATPAPPEPAPAEPSE